MSTPGRSELRTIMTADLEGFSTAMRADEEAVIRLLVDSYYAIAEREVTGQGGVVFRKEGDAIWCSFPSAVAGVRASIAIIEELTRRRIRQAELAQLGLRVGIHLGDVVMTEDGEVLGNTLSVAKRLETASAESAINVSEQVHDQIAGRDLGFFFHDMGDVDLKGVGPRKVYQGRITPERLEALRTECSRTDQVAGTRLLVSGFPGVLPEGDRIPWEREAMRLARAAGGAVFPGRDNVVHMVLEPSADIGPLLASTKLRAARLAVGLGEVLVQRGEDGSSLGVVGEVVEELRDALLTSGWEPAICLLTEQAAQVLGRREDVTLEVSGHTGASRTSGLYRLLPEGIAPSRLSRGDDPELVSGIGDDGPHDLVAGIQRGLSERGTLGPLGDLLAGLDSLGGSWTRSTVAPDVVGLQALEDDPFLGLALGLGAIAAMDGLPRPSEGLAFGKVQADGTLVAPAPESCRARLEAAATLVPPVKHVLAPAGVAEHAPPDLRVVELSDLAEAREWLESSGQGSRLYQLARAHVDGALTVVVLGNAGGEEELRQLGEVLARDADLDPEDPFLRLAEDAEEELGRDGLESRYRTWALALPPSELARSLGDLAPPMTISLFPDPRLQPRDGPGGGRVLCLGGRADSPGRLILTEADFEDLLASLHDLPAPARQRFSTDTLLLVAPAGADRALQNFLRELRRVAPAAEEARTFLAAGEVSESDGRRLERRGVEILEERPLALLEAVRVEAALLTEAERAEQAAREAEEETGTAMPARPYKFLDYYGPGDRSIFFGRDQEIEEVTTRLLTKPILVLYGRSGAGKTSLLQAGVLSRLTRPRHLTLTLRALSDPLKLMRNGLRALGPDPGATQDRPVGELIEQVCRCISGHLVIVLDQFEEFFVRLDAGARKPFLDAVAELVRGLPERAHLLFSLREDFLAEMSAFETRLPSILDNRFRLELLSEDQARQAIVGPAALFGVDVEEALVDRLLRDLFEEGVDPPQLQIVLDRLWQERADDQAGLGRDAYERLGGVRSILVGYLQSTVNEGLGERGELARRILKAMVTDRGTKAVVEVEDLTAQVASSASEVRAVVDELVKARLVRALAEEGEHHFELAHEFLIQEVMNWSSDDEVALRHARMVLESERENWDRFGSLMSPDRLALVERERGRLDLSEGERKVLVRAAAIHDRDLAGWLVGPEAQRAGVPVLVGMLEEVEIDAACRRRILQVLFELPVEDDVHEAMVAATRVVGNPTLLDALRLSPGAGRRPEVLRSLEAAVHQRFFGPEAMVEVPAGPTWIGSTQANKDERKAVMREDLHERVDSEPEHHQVEVAAFRMDRNLVTNSEFAEFRPVHAHRFPPEEADHPAVYVSWEDAVAYAEWLGKQLPTEEEWEKAARGPEGFDYPWGDEFDPAKVNSAESELRKTTPIGAYPEGASPYGCLDMAGNVWEWTASAWKDGGPFKTQKGGSTVNFAPHQQPSARFEGFPDFILQWVGFRCVSRGDGDS
jgi:formylglycine-generating enzyme required for sulfatase activity/class 3 adenylate cyclase